METAINWRACPRFPAFEVSDRGDLRFAEGKRRLKGYITADGYVAYRLRDQSGLRHEISAHALVLEAFIGPRPSPLHQGAHCDGSRLNNHPSNLRWAVPASNQRDRKMHGTDPAGMRNGRAKITDDDVIFIREEYRRIKAERGKRSPAELEARFGLHRATIIDIALGRSWKHLPMGNNPCEV